MEIKKSALPFFLFIFFAIGSCAQNTPANVYHLTISIPGLNSPDAKVYLASTLMRLNSETILDSATLKNGLFNMKGVIADPKQVFLILNKKGTGFKDTRQFSGILSFYLEKGSIFIDIRDSIKNAVITGSKINTEYKKYSQLLFSTKFDDEYHSIRKAIKEEVSPEKKKILEGEMLDLLNSKARYRDSAILTYTKENPGSYFSLEALNTFINRGFDKSILRPIFEGLTEELRNSKRGLDFLESLHKIRVEIGGSAIDFVLNDEKGAPVKLSDFKGKYLLLDFWASWCMPCRAENPNLVKAYAKYHNKGLEIMAVSLDTKKEAWTKAIEQENLPWTHVSDLKGFESEAAILYNVESIPKNLLITPDGKIFATDLRGYRLEETLSKIFK